MRISFVLYKYFCRRKLRVSILLFVWKIFSTANLWIKKAGLKFFSRKVHFWLKMDWVCLLDLQTLASISYNNDDTCKATTTTTGLASRYRSMKDNIFIVSLSCELNQKHLISNTMSWTFFYMVEKEVQIKLTLIQSLFVFG